MTELKICRKNRKESNSRKTGKVIGRPVKVLNLSKEEQDMLKRVQNKEISVKKFLQVYADKQILVL